MSKSGREQGAENVAKLESYLSTVDSIPERNGKANMSAIAEACGFDRQTLYKNPKAKQLLEEAIKKKGLKGVEIQEDKTPPEIAALERQISSLQQANSSLVAEVYELRSKLKRFNHIEDMLEQGKHVIS